MTRARHILGLAIFLVACERAQADTQLPPPSGPDAPAGPDVPALSDLAKKAEEEHPEAQLHYIGTTYAKDRVEVSAEVAGTLAMVAFEEGDTVKKGDVLFRLKAQNAKLSLARTQKNLAAAKQRLSTAERDLARIEKLHAAGAATPAALDQARAGRDAAEIMVSEAEVAVSQGKTGFSDTTSRAPIGGLVTEKRKSAGEAVTSMPPTVVLVIEDRDTLEVRVRVPELMLRKMQPGTKLQARFPALDVDHTIEVVRTGESVDPRTRTIEIICEVDNPDHALKPGMSVEVKPTA